MFYIKFPVKKDIPDFAAIDRMYHADPWNEKAFEVELSKFRCGKSVFYTAKKEDDDEILGYAAADMIVDYAHILNLTVKEEYRRKGIAKAFLEKIEREAGKRDFSSVTLEVNENNNSALELYKRAGYIIKGKRPLFYRNKDAAVIMWKYL
ncbi:MAG: ribosomal protein S18-alanine N-acetyltransferase [Candidatus Goldiibacteriota bacterium]